MLPNHGKLGMGSPTTQTACSIMVALVVICPSTSSSMPTHMVALLVICPLVCIHVRPYPSSADMLVRQGTLAVRLLLCRGSSMKVLVRKSPAACGHCWRAYIAALLMLTGSALPWQCVVPSINAARLPGYMRPKAVEGCSSWGHSLQLKAAFEAGAFRVCSSRLYELLSASAPIALSSISERADVKVGLLMQM